MNPDKPSLLLENDFSDFKTLPSCKKDKRSDTSSSAHSISSIDSDDKDLLYAHHYFIDTTGSGRGSTSSNTSPSVSDSEAILNKPNESEYIVIDSSSPTPTSSSSQPQRKRKKNNSKKGKTKKIKRSRHKGDDDMELGSDVEIINEETDSAHFLVTSDRQANVRARPPDKMAAEDTWYLGEKDLMGRDRYEKLHDFKRYSSQQFRCMNCKQKGHSRSDCPQSKRHTICYLCGKVNHVSSRCPDFLCQYCFEPSHRGRPCKSTLSNPRDYCRRCYMHGHSEEICTEQWRQFHNTTNGNNRLTTLDPGNSRNNDAVYCCSCAKQGHYVYECTQPRPRGCPFPFSPLIAHYEHMQQPTTSRPQLNTRPGILTTRPGILTTPRGILTTPTVPPPRWDDEGTSNTSQERSHRKRSSSHSGPASMPRPPPQSSRRSSYQGTVREPYNHRHSNELYHNNISNPPSPYPYPPSPHPQTPSPYPPPRHYSGEGSGDYYNNPPPYPPPDPHQRRPSYVSPGYDNPRRDSRGSVGDQYGNEFPRSSFSRPPTPYYETHSVTHDRRPPGGYSGSGERITIQSVSVSKGRFKRKTRVSNERSSRRRTN